MLKDPTEVFEAVVNNDDKKPPPASRIDPTPDSANPPLFLLTVEIEEVKWGMRMVARSLLIRPPRF